MDSLTMAIEPEEHQGRRALVEVSRAAAGTAPPIEAHPEGEIAPAAKALVRQGGASVLKWVPKGAAGP